MHDIPALKAIYESHAHIASELLNQFRRLWKRELSIGETNVICGYVLCRTHSHLNALAARLCEQELLVVADTEISRMSDALSEGREEVIRLIALAYQHWQIALDPVDFPNLLAWEAALVKRLP